MQTQQRWTVERATPAVGGWVAVGAVIALSTGSGLAVFVGLGLLALAGGWPVAVALAGAGVVVLAVWAALIPRAWGLLFIRERAELPVAAAEPPRQRVALEISEPEQNRMLFLDLGVTGEQLVELAHGLSLGRPLSESQWTGSGRPFAKSEFHALRGTLVERGLAQWRDVRAPSQGVELTAPGRAVFRRLAEARTHASARTGGDVRLLPPTE